MNALEGGVDEGGAGGEEGTRELGPVLVATAPPVGRPPEIATRGAAEVTAALVAAAGKAARTGEDPMAGDILVAPVRIACRRAIV